MVVVRYSDASPHMVRSGCEPIDPNMLPIFIMPPKKPSEELVFRAMNSCTLACLEQADAEGAVGHARLKRGW
jgi:hypothetical protein